MSDVSYGASGAVATLTLARAHKRNALTDTMLQDMRSHVQQALATPSVRVLVLAADGPAFCAGADLAAVEMGERDSFANSAAASLAALLSELLDFDKPVVCRVQGPVAGGGNGLLAASDVVIASASASFALREVRIGVAPAVIAVPLLRRLHPGAVRDLMLSGRSIDAEEARSVGLVNRVVEPAELDAAVERAVGELLLAGPHAQAATKRLLRELPGLDRSTAFARAVEVSVERFTSDEATEGIAAFLEKRSPSW